MFSLLGFTQALNNLQQQLEQIKNAKYDNALAIIKQLSQDKKLGSFFNNPDFIRIFARSLFYRKGYANAEKVARAIDTPGAREYLRQEYFITAVKEGNVAAVKDFLASGIIELNTLSQASFAF